MGSISPSKNEQVFEAVSILLMGIHPVVLTVTLIAQKTTRGQFIFSEILVKKEFFLNMV